MPGLVRLECWTDVECAAGATCLAHVAGVTALSEQVGAVDGERTVTLTLPSDVRSAPFLAVDRVLRLRMDSAADPGYLCVERRISKVKRSHGPTGLLTTVTARGIRQDLGTRALVVRRNATGRVEHTFSVAGVSLATHVEAFILPRLRELGYTWWSLGTVESDQAISSFVYDSDTPLSAILRLADAVGLEFAVRALFDEETWKGTGYALDFVHRIGATSPIIRARPGKQLTNLDVEESAEDQATVIAAVGQVASDGSVATLAGARWLATLVDPATGAVTLADQVGGAGPIGFDGQETGMALTWAGCDGPRLVLDSLAESQRVVLDDVDGLVPGTAVWFVYAYAPTGAELAPGSDAEAGTDGDTATEWTFGTGAAITYTDEKVWGGALAYKMTNASPAYSYRARSFEVEAGDLIRVSGAVAGDGALVGSVPAGAGVGFEVWSNGAAFELETVAYRAPLLVRANPSSVFVGLPANQPDDAYHGVWLVLRAKGAGTVSVACDVGYAPQLVQGSGYFDNISVKVCSDVAGDVASLSHPLYRAQYGSRVAVLPRPEIPDTINLVPNGALRTWVPATGSAAPDGVRPAGWRLVGPGATVRLNTDPIYWRSGEASAHLVLPADAYFETEPFRHDATMDEPYLAALAQFYLVTGKVVLELLLDSAASSGPALYTHPQDAGESIVVNIGDHNWFIPHFAGVNLLENNLGWLRLRVRALEATELYFDGGQVTATATDREFVEGAAPTRLWQAVNERLEEYAPPAVAVTAGYLDLETVGGGVLMRDVLQPGQRLDLTDPVLGLTVTTRLLGWQRDWAKAENVGLTISNRPIELTRLLARLPSPARPPSPPTPSRRYVPPPTQPCETLLQLVEIAGTGPSGLIAVVTPSANVNRYRLYRRKGAWPTTNGLPGGELDPAYFVCSRSVLPDGGGVLADGATCAGGRGDPWAYSQTRDVTPSRDPNVTDGWLAGDMGFVVVVPLDATGNPGTRAYASRAIVIGTTPHVTYAAPLESSRLPGSLGCSWAVLGYSPTDALLVVEESVDGAPWVEVYGPLAVGGALQNIINRGAGYYPGGETDRLVTWRWRILVRDLTGALIGAIATTPYTLRAVRAA